MAVSMSDIARKAGLSRVTISLIFSGQWQARGISSKTYERVMNIANELNFRPNRLARGLVSGKTHSIGVQLPSFKHQYWSDVMKELDLAARQKDYHLLLCAPAAWQEERQEVERLYDYQVDGLILSPRVARRLGSLYKWLKKSEKPFVFLGNIPNMDHYSVVDDNLGQAKQAVEHLISLGHKIIGHISGSASSFAAIHRRRGYFESLAEHDLESSRVYVRSGASDIDLSKAAMLDLLKLAKPPTAVYCANDIMAMGAIAAIEEKGMRVGEDIAVVGHGDDIPFSEFQRVPLTTVRQPRKLLSQTVMEMLVDLIEGRQPSEKCVKLPGKLVIRNSSGAS